MTDEKFVFTQDVKDKGITARSARSKRTHNGKGGAVKFPSDFMTRKELNAMNGEVKSYRLNEPMTWNEFKYMPDDIKVTYIKLIREKFNVSDSCIARMLGISQNGFANHVRRLGLGLGRGSGNQKCDKEGWIAWCNGVPATTPEAAEAPVTGEKETDVPACPIPENGADSTGGGVDMVIQGKAQAATPCHGNMIFECPADQALNMMAQVLGNVNVCINISWNVIDEAEKGVKADG